VAGDGFLIEPTKISFTFPREIFRSGGEVSDRVAPQAFREWFEKVKDKFEDGPHRMKPMRPMIIDEDHLAVRPHA